jgi:MoxR-like ATPase
MRLGEFEPRVLTSFVRNRLIDEVYLPLIGDNLAKQIGAAGDRKRTDLMGLLLLISPPGYGKTTLVEYLANRLGIVFVKINGPALGQGVNSLDPEETPNAAAREEIQKLNLALEMGDNVMLCVDDIQHCSPEFLQKFISLCDAQRKIEGVWRGKPRTYDLRGRKVVVVMAGNPYTESGQRFKLPDMLANRADTYNLGDIIGGHADRFKSSYLENAMTSNAVLAPLANKSQKDVQAFIRIAETGDRENAEFEGSYSSRETEEILSVLRKLVAIREVVLRVNLEYIHSAGQADEYRTEPPFRLQGSYRNMNRLAEKVVAIMDDREVQALVLDHYRTESQTLTTGAEANLLKFKELVGLLTADERSRWDDITKTFRRNQFARGADPSDPVGRVVAQLSAFQSGLEGIQGALQSAARDQLTKAPAPIVVDLQPLSNGLDALREAVTSTLSRPAAKEPSERGTRSAANELAAQLSQGLKALREDLSRAITAVHSGTMADKVESLSHELEMIHSTLATLKDVAAQQRDHLRAAQELLAARAKQGTVEIDLTQEMLTNEQAFLERFHQVLAEAQREPEPPDHPPTP